MRMKFRFVVGVLFLISLCILTSCSNSTTTTSTNLGTGYLWVSSAGNTSIQPYTIDFNDGELTSNGNPVTTGTAPSAVIVAPSGKAMFTANRGANSVSAYTINGDGTLTEGSTTYPTGQTPVSLAMDPGGKFLFVANQADSTISVFSVSGTTLTAVGAFSTSDPTYPNQQQTAPSALTVSASGNYLYVANQLTNAVSGFQYDSTSGALTPLTTFSVPAGTNPTALVMLPTLTAYPGSSFLYVANSGSNNISAFAACTVASASCSTPNGLLTEVSGSPFSAGINPVSLAVTPGGAFLYAADSQSNELSGYKIGASTGFLTPTTTATFSTGTTPIWVSVPPEGLYVYVANYGSGSITAYGINTTNGFLGEVSGSPYQVSNAPTALALR
jgi:6-phosphogluconolactonase (cycloisomerase 2 family)